MRACRAALLQFQPVTGAQLLSRAPTHRPHPRCSAVRAPHPLRAAAVRAPASRRRLRVSSELTPDVSMVQPFSWVLWNSVVMFVGAFGAGMSPLAVQLDESRLRTVRLNEHSTVLHARTLVHCETRQDGHSRGASIEGRS
jgi:hypothetical protein